MHNMISPTVTYVAQVAGNVKTQAETAASVVAQVSSLTSSAATLSQGLQTAARTLAAYDSTATSALSALQANAGSVVAPGGALDKAADAMIASVGSSASKLGVAANNILADEASNVNTALGALMSAFSRGQAALGRSMSQQTGPVTDAANAAIADGNNWISEMQNDVTTAQGQLSTQQSNYASAVSAVSTKLNGIIQQMTNYAPGQLAIVDAAQRTALETAYTQALAMVETQRTKALSSLAAADSTLSAQDQAASSQILDQLAGLAQTLQASVVRVQTRSQDASNARDDAVAAMGTTQTTQRNSTATAVTNMNKAIQSFVALVANTKATISGQSDQVLGQFNDLGNAAASKYQRDAGDVSSQLGGSMENVNSDIGSATATAEAASANNAVGFLNSLASTRADLASTNANQFGSIQDMIVAVDQLMKLLKAKMSSTSDQASSNLDLLNSMVSGSTADIMGTLQDIASQKGSDAVNTLRQMSAAAAAAYDRGKSAADKQAQAIAQVQTQTTAGLSRIAQQQEAMGNSGAQLVGDATNAATQLAQANADVSDQVSAAISQSNGNWQAANNFMDGLTASAPAAIGGLSAKGAAAIRTLQSESIAAVQSKAKDVINVVSQMQQTSLNNAKAAMSDLSTAGTDLLNNVNKVSNDTAATLSAAKAYANATITSLSTLPAVFSASANEVLTNTSAIVVAAQNDAVRSVTLGQTLLVAEIANKTASLQQYADTRLADFGSRLRSLSVAVAAQAAYHNSLAGSMGDDSLFTLSNDDFEHKIASAADLVANASSDQADRYDRLHENLTAAGTRLHALVSNVTQALALFNALVPGMAQGSVLGATGSIQRSLADMDAVATNMSNAYITVLSNRYDYELNASTVRRQSIQNILSQMAGSKGDLLNALANSGLSNQAKEALLAASMDSIVASITALAGGNAQKLAFIQSQFAQMQLSAGGLSASLQSALTNSIAGVTDAADRAAASTIADINANSAASQAQLGTMGNQVQYALQILQTGTAAQKAALARNDAQAYALAQQVLNLGGNAASNIAKLLGQISSGQITMQDALAAKANVSVDQLNTVQDVANAFSNVMQAYLDQVKLLFDNEQINLQNFQNTVPNMIRAYEQMGTTAISAAQGYTTVADNQASKFGTDMTAAITTGKTLVANAWTTLNSLSANISSSIDTANVNVASAVMAAQNSQDALAKSIIAKATATQTAVVTKLLNFQKKAAPESSYSLAAIQVAIPTGVPRI